MPTSRLAAARPMLVVAALAEELGPLRRRTVGERRAQIAGVPVLFGRLGAAPVAIACVGVGRAAAGRATGALLDGLDVRGLLVVGVCGGLSPELAVGQVLVGARVVDGQVPAPDPDPALVARARGLAGVRAATLLTSARVLPTPAAKDAAWRTMRSSELSVVDMETAACAVVATARGVPYVALRAVSDTAAQHLPLDFARLRRADGSLRRLVAMRWALRHPSAVARVLCLRTRVSRCARRLARCVDELLNG